MIYLFYGEEKYEMYKEIESIKKKMGNLEVGVNYYNINKENMIELEPLYNSVTFFGSNKLVIIKETMLKFDVKKLIAEADENDSYIIIEDSVDRRTSDFKELQKNATVKEFKYLNENEMAQYIINILKCYDVKIDKPVAEYMVSVCGIDKSNNINELNKLVAYLGKEGNVTKDVIDKVCSKTLNAKIFDMLDMAIAKNYKEAINMLDELLMAKEPAIKIAIMLYKQIKQMYMIKLLKKAGNSKPNDILKIHPFVYSKISKASESYEEEHLKNLIILFDEYDEKTKIGMLDFEVGLKKILCIM